MKVGFIGLGIQGKGLALNLIEAEHDLIVFDLRREPLDELAAAGARIAASAREVAAHAEIIEICVLDDSQVDDVVLGPKGVLEGTSSGAIIVIHSTVEPATIYKLADAAKSRGVEIVDAPVSGGDAGARRKTMSYMVGGSDRAVDRCMPLFETSGRKITRTGPIGSGMKAKLAHQVIICINLLAAYEGMRLGREAGLSQEVLEKIVHEGSAQSWIADHWSRLSMKHLTPVLHKDLELCLKAARALGLAAPGAELTQRLLDKIVP
jgi:3-hydroxyisobutyrate dehydrogenase-like beta-hydroxyacid dehydrogenase